MRRRFAAFPTALLLLALLAPAVVAGQTAPSTPGRVVSSQPVNVRECPRADCAVRFGVRPGETLDETGPATDGWLPVERDGIKGYAWSLYVAAGATPELSRGAPGCNRVALIVNLGVNYETRMEPLEWLAERDIPATIFAMGQWADQNPDELRRMAELGFPIGSHGDQRNELTGLGDGAVTADVRAAEAAIAAVIGEKPAPYFTPFSAATDERVRSLVAAAGYLNVGWDVAADDWDFGVTADDVFMNVVPNVVDGSIVEFHLDAPTSAESTRVAIPWIVERLERKGYEFVTISDMALPCS
ncbi:MAG TPA: polysaccharide deacetylase family protein [Thermomicrobiales bacterium]|nr:polysaccharide deacetylase family protein [Thermomicrobiales bacterium]